MVAKLIKISFLILSFAALQLLFGCDMVIFNPKGIIAAAETDLLIICVLIMLIIVIPTIVLIFVFAWKYRASNTKATYLPNWAHSTKIEIICWGVPILIIAVLATITWISSHELDPYKPLDVKAEPIKIEVIALDWKWLFIYPDYDIATVNFIQFPEDRPINFQITADAPMNSFLIPQLGGQIYAMAGMRTKLHLMADEVGDFNGISSNYSGFGFSGMKFIARASSQADFDAWIKSVQLSPDALTMTAYNRLIMPSKNNSVAYFSQVHSQLFESVMKKYMSPHPMTDMSSDSSLSSDRMHSDMPHPTQSPQ